LSTIIVELGSGETCKNDRDTIRRMVDSIIDLDTQQHEIVFKWQLLKEIPKESPPDLKLLSKDAFDFAYGYIWAAGYRCTASVFDMDSLSFLLTYDIPFVKIACRRSKYWLIDMVPRKIPVYVSVESPADLYFFAKDNYNVKTLCCVPKYPASSTEYETLFGYNLSLGISDHSESIRLFNEYRPQIYERHIKLADSTGYDAGAYSSLPEELGDIL
jgi:hypothetical protein